MSAPKPDQTGERSRFTNRLAAEKSPYLLQHAHNPVDWYPWGEAAFAAARDGDKPIFLSIGYSACHWCHVMERESFENDKIAGLLNARFISIKVDREERPDVDEVYMTAVQMTTGSGGWPMSVFLLPDGRPFYGGTYFPPDSRQGRIGFGSLIAQLADAYVDRRSEVETVAGSIADELQKLARQRPVPSADVIDADDLLTSAIADMGERFDPTHGGFGGAPKFPPHHALRLLTLAARRGHADAPRMLNTTLHRMASGGIYDQFGGGFHRYATDAVWLVPHFEKMLYDNALLARVYAEAYSLTGSADYARVAREVCDWVIRDMTDAVGGFHAALDADSEGEEGRYYVWTQSEVRLILADSAITSEFCRAYHILPNGNYRDEATGQPTGANIPYLSVGAADQVTLPPTVEPAIETSRQILLGHRYDRVPPNKDDKVITAWNGLMIGALAVCGASLDEPRYITAARAAADFCLTTLRSPDGGLLRRYAKGEAGLPAFLDDYAFLGDGLLDLYEATDDVRYLEEALALADMLLDRFWDAEDAGFFYAAEGHEALIARTKDLFDGALPSANGVAVRLLARLGLYPDGQLYRERAAQTLTAYAGVLARAPQGTPTLIEAALLASEAARSSDTIEPAINAPVTLSAVDSKTIVGRGQTVTLTFTLRIAAGYHINAAEPANAELIPTTTTLTSNAPAAVGPVGYPEAILWESAGETLPIYQGDARFIIPVAVAAGARPGTYRVDLAVRLQACSETACLAPSEVTATAEVVVRG